MHTNLSENAESFAEIDTALLPHQVCIKCDEMKPRSAFAKQKQNKNGLSHTCKPCVNQYNKIYREKNRDRMNKHKKEVRERNKAENNDKDKMYYQKNRARIIQHQLKHYHENKDRILQYWARHYQKNKFRINERTKLYQQKNGKKNYQKNKSKVLSRQKEYKQKNKVRFKQRHKLYYQKNKSRIYQYLKNKKQIDFNFKLKHILRSRIHNALKSKRATKDSRTIKLLGCSISNFRAHIEKQFVAGMSNLSR